MDKIQKLILQNQKEMMAELFSLSQNKRMDSGLRMQHSKTLLALEEWEEEKE